MKIVKTPHDRVIVATKHDRLEPVSPYDVCAVPVNHRELVLMPKEYDGRMVRAAYDRETDTLYIND